MGSAVHFSASLLLCLLLSSSCGVPAVGAQDLQELDALCNEHGCYVVYFQRKTFLDAWRACKQGGGNLATIKRPEEADAIAELFANVDLRHSRMEVQVWIGLQRQPRQCKPSRPLRGFSWTTGDQDTEFTNWQREDSPNACSAPRCVVMGYDSSVVEWADNFQWLDGSCYVPADGYVCHYTYKGMCPALWSEGAGNALYATPFNLLTTLLTHLPFGTVATVPCPMDANEERSLLCTANEDGGAVSWSHNGPLCAEDAPVSTKRCEQGNGGCEHFCREAGGQHYCQCSEGFQLADDGKSCEMFDVCREAMCEFECLPLPDGHRCACPEGYMLAPDEQGCLDVDECLQSPCEQLCVNSLGSFECRCREGFQPADDGGECKDVDECMNSPCEHACENTPGSHVCNCHMGFSVSPEDPRQCQETDECQIPGTCAQMCVNYVGGFDCYCEEGYELGTDHYTCKKINEGEDGQPDVTSNFPWTTQPESMWNPDFFHWTPQESQTDWPDSLHWLTDPPGVQSPDVIWVTSAPQVETPLHITIDTSTQEPEGDLGEEGELLPNVFNRGVKPESPTNPTPTPTYTPPPPTTTYTIPTRTSPTLTTDWYGEEEEETTTGVSAAPASTTISEGASNWLWFSPNPTAHQSVTTEYEEPLTDSSVSSDYGYHGEEEKNAYNYNFSEGPKLAEEEKKEGGNGGDQEVQHPTTSTSGRGVATADQGEAEKQTSSTWLLVGLLVPIGILVLVMVALAVVYCTRCAAQPRNKSTTDCYHWISGAHDKQGAGASSAAAGKSQV